MIPAPGEPDVVSTDTVFRLWKDRNFLSLMIGTGLSALGDGAYFIVLGWFVLNVTGSEFALGTTLTFASIPRIVFMLLGGAAADRIDRKRILMLSLLVRALILAGFAVLLIFLNGKPPIAIIDAMAVLFGIIDAFFYPASGSIVPSAVPASSLAKANSLVQTGQQLSMVLGPLLAAGLLLFHVYQDMFMVIAVVFALSSAMLSRLRLRSQSDLASPAPPEIAESVSIWRDIAQGVQYVWSVRILLIVMMISLVINLLFMGPINIGIPVLIKSFGWTGGTYGMYEAGFGLGTVFGGLVVFVMRGFRGRFLWLGVLGSIMGMAMTGIGFVHAPWAGIGLMVIMGMAVSVVNIPFLTYIQTIVPANKLGRTMSVLTLMSMGLVPVSYTVSSFLLERNQIPVRGLLLICGLAITVLFATLYVYRDFREAESHPLWKVGG